jgi:protein-S-isoprenylcysteine O-methyltransferase Ste14
LGIINLCDGINRIIPVLRAKRSEEKMMIEQFGDEYKKYIQITGRFFPRLR